MTTEIVDGGDRGCGELLLVLAARVRSLPSGSTIRLIASDPAAPIDLPAWCHLTGHLYLGPGRDADDRACYDLRLRDDARETSPLHPWRLAPEPSGTHHREDQP